MRRNALVSTLTAMMAGCVAQNPAYQDATSGTGGSSNGGDLTETTGGGGTGKPKTTGMSGAAVSGESDETTSESAGEVTGSSSGERGTSTTEAPTEPERLTVVLLASDPVPGTFAGNDDFQERGRFFCSGAFGQLATPPRCDWGIAFIATETVPFSTYVESNPELDSAAFESVDGVALAESYEALTLGEVVPSFPAAVTGPVALDNNPSFWWGPGPHCANWSEEATTGRTLTFSSTAPGMVLDGQNPCAQTHRLLCGCAVWD